MDRHLVFKDVGQVVKKDKQQVGTVQEEAMKKQQFV